MGRANWTKARIGAVFGRMKGAARGNLRQWIANRTDNWGDLHIAPIWPIRAFALAFRKARAYLRHIPDIVKAKSGWRQPAPAPNCICSDDRARIQECQ
ncbi:hypothetical protein [Novosphingobium sp.]|uniref:hypothetical protein n=1 Tax=Novosphingobium sp. TaxID=1874826 RepID=UPI003D0B08BF